MGNFAEAYLDRNSDLRCRCGALLSGSWECLDTGERWFECFNCGEKYKATRFELLSLRQRMPPNPYLPENLFYTTDPAVAEVDPNAILVWSTRLGPKEGNPGMSCPKERPFVYMIINRGSGGDGTPQEPSSIVVDRTTMMAKSPEDVMKRALYELAWQDAKQQGSGPQIVRSLESLEVLVDPFHRSG